MKAFAEKLKAADLKVTPQRLAIYASLCGTKEHPSAETIYKKLEAEYPTMSLATVYKTLDILRSSGLIQELNVGEDSFRYDACTKPHPHLVCRKCRRVTDMDSVAGLEEIRERVSREMNFQVEGEQIYFFGVCCECGVK